MTGVARGHFVLWPHQGEASFTLGCWCNTGIELDTYGAALGEQLVRFWAEHWNCQPSAAHADALREAARVAGRA